MCLIELLHDVTMEIVNDFLQNNKNFKILAGKVQQVRFARFGKRKRRSVRVVEDNVRVFKTHYFVRNMLKDPVPTRASVFA